MPVSGFKQATPGERENVVHVVKTKMKAERKSFVSVFCDITMRPVLITLLCLTSPLVLAAPRVIQIGALFHGTDSQQELVFKYAVDMINANRSIRIVGLSERVKEYDNLEVFETMCKKMMCKGVWAVFGPQSSYTSEHVQSICDTMEIPHIETRWDLKHKRQDILVNLFPHPAALAKVYVELVQAWKWKTFTIIYEDNEGLTRISLLLKMYNQKGFTVTVRKLNAGADYRPLLRTIKHSGETNFVLDCTLEHLPEILKQTQQLGLLAEEYNFIITQIDFHNIDLELYQHGGANITGVRLINPNDPFVSETVHEWAKFNKRGRSISIAPQELLAESALMYDAVHLFARTVQRMLPSKVNATPVSCEHRDSWVHGYSLVNLMKDSNSVYKGLTGTILFDNEGFRSSFVLDIIELTVNGLKKVGTWNSSEGLNLNRTHPPSDSRVQYGIGNKTLKVLTAISMPYGMRKNTPEKLTGNDRYEGFGIEVIHEISVILGFNYTFDLQRDSNYGGIDENTGEWTGMIRRIQDGEADLAITDLTITAERQTGADFTLPFMNLGISILYKKPTRASPKLFSFMDPFSMDVWIVMFFGYIGVSFLLFIMGRICPYEWTNPYPCIEEPETLENQFSLNNSLWFTIGSLMQQGSEIAPIAVSTRMIAGIWWFFTLIMVSSYTANLAAFLTVESMSQPFKAAEDLVDQTAIQYGAKANGSTLNFFRDSDNPIFQRMYQFMSTTEGVLTKTNEEGLKKVKNENYAFFMESTSIEYMVERNCEVQQYGGLLDNKGYGIAMRKGYEYRNELNEAVLKLQETGQLMKLKDKWWKEERGGGQCQSAEISSGSTALQLVNVGGVFVVLVGGIVLAVFVNIFELLWNVCQTSMREKVSFRDELVEELRFIGKFHGSTKPVRKYNQDIGEDVVPMSPYPYGFVTNSKEPLT